MRPSIKTTKTMKVKASDGYDVIELRGVTGTFGSEDGVPSVFFEHRQGRNYRGSLILPLDHAEDFANEVLRFVEFQRTEVEG